MTSINTNTASVIAANALKVNERQMSTAMERLSTGLRVNSAKDDAAGLAISKKMDAQVAGLRQASRNANDGISMLQTFEGASKEVTNMLTRIRELTIQGLSGTLTETDQSNLVAEMNQLNTEIQRVVADTQWNTMSLLKNSTTAGTDQTVVLQIGANASQTATVTIMDWNATAVSGGTGGINIAATATAGQIDSTYLGLIDGAISAATTERATYGAWISRLEHTSDNLLNVAQTTEASQGRIEDADYAAETTELARTQIIAQAGTAMLAQANQVKQSVLALLK